VFDINNIWSLIIIIIIICGSYNLSLFLFTFFCVRPLSMWKKTKYSWLCRRVKQTSNVFLIWFVESFQCFFYFRLGLLQHQLHQAFKPKSFLTDSL
jgi:hypothetical protein